MIHGNTKGPECPSAQADLPGAPAGGPLGIRFRVDKQSFINQSFINQSFINHFIFNPDGPHGQT